jgi:DNA-binding NarL/FixJ family response regulator
MRVVIGEDSALFREGLARLLADTGVDIVATAVDAPSLVDAVREHRPDVAVTDIRMPPTHSDEGLRAAQTIRQRFPKVSVLVLSQHIEPTYASELLSDSAEGVGYLLKDRVFDVADFVATVRRVGQGGSALDPEVLSRLVSHRGDDPLSDLTAREREVLGLMAEGRSNKGIADRLVLTERAVEKHVGSILTKLRLPAAPEDHRRVLAVLTFLRS